MPNNKRPAATNARSSGIELDSALVRELSRRSDRPGLWYLGKWLLCLLASGSLVYLSLDSFWLWPAMFLHGMIITVPAYSISHETAHGTAFETRWLNEAVFWFSSLLYMEEPLHRRYTHTRHHMFTWHVGQDSQMPFDTPMKLGGWLMELSGLALLRFHIKVLWQIASARFSPLIIAVCPGRERPKMVRNAWLFTAIYTLIAVLIVTGIATWLLWFLVLPQFLGGIVMLMFTLTQHVELQENSPSILESTRSFTTNVVGRFLYMNMNYHIEHHLYTHIPFYSLPQLSEALREQLPASDPGMLFINADVFGVVANRSLGRNTKARYIRQAPHMVTKGKVEVIASRTM